MDALARFEDIIESTIEGALAAVVSTRLQPVEIAKRLARTLDGAQTFGVDGARAPNVYCVLVNQRDFETLAPIKQTLERELVAYLQAAARERSVTFVAPPSVTLEPAAGVRPRRLRIQATMAEQPAEDASAGSVGSGFTARLPIAQVRQELARVARLSTADGRTILLSKAVTSIGRQLDNDIVLEDGRVSRRHAQLRYEQHSYCLYDLASANGAFVNGERIERMALRDGDVISLGGLEITFHLALQEARRGA